MAFIHFCVVTLYRLNGPVVLVTRDEGSVMLANKVIQASRQAMLTCHFQPIRHMSDDGLGTHLRIKVIVGVDLAGWLVLNKEERVRRFTYIVEQGSHSREEGISLPVVPQFLPSGTVPIFRMTRNSSRTTGSTSPAVTIPSAKT